MSPSTYGLYINSTEMAHIAYKQYNFIFIKKTYVHKPDSDIWTGFFWWLDEVEEDDTPRVYGI